MHKFACFGHASSDNLFGLTMVTSIAHIKVMSDDMSEHSANGKILSPAAKRALKEAADRRKASGQDDTTRPSEQSGPKGAEPTRYGDWERGGIAYDF